MQTTPYQQITNPHKDDINGNETLIQARLGRKVYTYFFRHVLVGSRGQRQALINSFFQALYDECQREKIPARFDELNEHRIATILSRINFRGAAPTSRARRSPDTSPKSQAQPAAQGHDDGRADGVRE